MVADATASIGTVYSLQTYIHIYVYICTCKLERDGPNMEIRTVVIGSQLC